jgi:hypothetical protein
MSGRLLGLTIMILVVTAGCASNRVLDGDEQTLAYNKIICEDGAGIRQVGWLETVGRVDSDGVRMTIGLVKAMDYEIRGYLRSEGMAVKYIDKAPAYKSALGETRHYVELPRATREHLVKKILELSDEAKLKFPMATVSDIH